MEQSTLVEFVIFDTKNKIYVNTSTITHIEELQHNQKTIIYFVSGKEAFVDESIEIVRNKIFTNH